MTARTRDPSGGLPAATTVILPKPLPMNRGALWVLFWTVGLLMGLFARDIVDGPGGARWHAVPASGDPGSSPASFPAQPPEITLRAVLELPSPTPTNTPKATATATSDPNRSQDFCGAATPGAVCKVPHPTPPPPTPYPSCVEMKRLSPGDWCAWPTEATRPRGG